MDPTTRLNALRQYMEFYRRNNMGGTNYSTGMGFNPTPQNTDAMAAQWAEGQMGQEQGGQDFYSSQGPQYVSPRPVQALAKEAGFPLAPQDQTQTQMRPVSDMREMGLNYLRNLLRR